MSRSGKIESHLLYVSALIKTSGNFFFRCLFKKERHSLFNVFYCFFARLALSRNPYASDAGLVSWQHCTSVVPSM